jgi:2-oxoglutarate dehydrogenase E2 component (dihydrolipoamide succinyltransferase)
MPTTVTMPQLGETVVEGTIVKWLKAAGDTVERDEPLFEISTDKVDTEVPSPVAGIVTEIKVPEGETVSVGTELAVVDESGNGQAPAAEQTGEVKAEATSGAGNGQAAAQQPDAEPAAAAAPPAAPPPAQAAPRQEAAVATAPAPSGERGARSHILSPLVRRLAEEHGIDLNQVPGTGTGGRITKKDIQAFIASGGAQTQPAAGQAAAAPAPAPAPATAPAPAAAPAPAPAPATVSKPAVMGGREEVVPVPNIRKRIAENMVASLQSSARAWNMVEVNMESIVKLRAKAKDNFKAREGFSLTYMPFLARAVCDALLAYPDVNARLDLEAGTITYRGYVNIGVAVATDSGLIVPVVKGADSMNLTGIARAINDLATRTRNKKLLPDEVHGSTFTITNPGPYGSMLSVPIMNPGETAILAFDAIEKRPVVVDDMIGIRHMVYLSMSWDHRMIDGATAAQFLGRLKQNLETWDFTPEVQAYLS